MAATHRNRLVTAISNTPGAAGALTISTAASGYRTFGAADDGLSFDVSIVDGTAWEIRTGCVYTHAGTSLARGTREDSSSGGDITLTSAAVVTVTSSAGRGESLSRSVMTDAAGTDAATTMTTGTNYVLDMSGWTANRTYTLPATAKVGDRVGVMVSTGSASYECLITAGTGDFLNSIAGGTEWSRVFITGEILVFRCVGDDSTWIVETDGRIPQIGRMSLTGSDITTSAVGWTGLNFTNSDIARGCTVDVAVAGASLITWRRASYVIVNASWASKASATCADNEQMGWGVAYGGVPDTGTNVCKFVPNHAGTTAKPVAATLFGAGIVPAGSQLQMAQYAQTTANLGARALAPSNYCNVTELF